MKQKQFSEKWIWLTGASSGIGKTLAHCLLKQGAHCIISARSEDKLKAIQADYPMSCYPLVMDIKSSENSLSILNQLQRITKKLDYAILNAGICRYVDVEHFDRQVFEDNMNSNFLGTVYCIEIALPLLYKADAPLLAIMSSSATYLPFPRAAAYGASKAALSYMGRSLAVDLSKKNVAVTIIEPGFVKTPLTDKNDFHMPSKINADLAAELIGKGLIKRKKTIRFPRFFIWTLLLIAMLPERLQFYFLTKLKQ